MVNQWLRWRLSGLVRELLPKLLHKIIIHIAKPGSKRNSFDCVAPHSARSDRWVRDRHHVGISRHRIVRHYERRYFYRPRRGRLPVALVTGALTSSRFNNCRLPAGCAAPAVRPSGVLFAGNPSEAGAVSGHARLVRISLAGLLTLFRPTLFSWVAKIVAVRSGPVRAGLQNHALSPFHADEVFGRRRAAEEVAQVGPNSLLRCRKHRARCATAPA
jgi:hypothetical protein